MKAAPNNRRLAGEFVVAAVLCGASYYALADSATSTIAQVRRDIEQAQQRDATQSGVGGLTDAQIQELRRTTVERAARMRELSAPARDEAAMFARISELANALSVRVEQLNPSAVQIAGSGPVQLPAGVSPGTPAAAMAQNSPQSGPESSDGAKDARIGYTMTVTGSYTDIAHFVGALTDRLGYTMIKSVRLSQPDVRTADALRATIETEHFALDLSAIRMSGPAPAVHQPMPVAPATAGAKTDPEGE